MQTSLPPALESFIYSSIDDMNRWDMITWALHSLSVIEEEDRNDLIENTGYTDRDSKVRTKSHLV